MYLFKNSCINFCLTVNKRKIYSTISNITHYLHRFFMQNVANEILIIQCGNTARQQEIAPRIAPSNVHFLFIYFCHFISLFCKAVCLLRVGLRRESILKREKSFLLKFVLRCTSSDHLLKSFKYLFV